MRFFKTQHEKNSAKLTALIAVVLLLLLFVVGAKYMDPPEEYGLAVNFGDSSMGMGDNQPMEPVKSEPREVEELPQPEEMSATEPTTASEAKEEVLTADNAEDIAIKKQKEAEAKAKAEMEAKAKAEAERIAKEKKRREEIKREQDARIAGIKNSDGPTGSEGDDNVAGDKGQLDGDPYASSYFGGGTGSGGIGYGLNGRGKATFKTIKQDCNESGLVIVRIIVNQNGNVISAEPGQKGTTNTASCLLIPAKEIALSHKWPPDSNAPEKQIGFVKVNFKIGQ